MRIKQNGGVRDEEQQTCMNKPPSSSYFWQQKGNNCEGLVNDKFVKDEINQQYFYIILFQVFAYISSSTLKISIFLSFGVSYPLEIISRTYHSSLFLNKPSLC